MNKFLRLLIRIIASPFVFGLLLITYSYSLMLQMYNFIKYGGEFIQYKKDDKATIKDIYAELVKQREVR